VKIIDIDNLHEYYYKIIDIDNLYEDYWREKEEEEEQSYPLVSPPSVDFLDQSPLGG